MALLNRPPTKETRSETPFDLRAPDHKGGALATRPEGSGALVLCVWR